MKPSLTPCFFSKPSLCLARSAISALMSTSLKVVSSAHVSCAPLSLSAIRCRIRDMGTRRSRSPAASAAAAGAAAGLGAAAAGLGGAAAAAGGGGGAAAGLGGAGGGGGVAAAALGAAAGGAAGPPADAVASVSSS